MQKNINKSKKTAPIICALFFTVFLSLVLAWIIFPLIKNLWNLSVAVAFLGVYGLLVVGMIVGIFMALVQRLREIDSGEEEEAKKY